MAGFTEAEEYAEVCRHNGEDVQNQAHDADGVAFKALCGHSQGGNILGVRFNGLVVTHSQVKGNRIEEYDDEEDAEGDVHRADRLVAGNFDGLVVGPVGNNHGAQALDKQDRRKRKGQHDDRLLDEVFKVGEGAEVGQIPVLYHDDAQDNADFRQNHARRQLEEQLFAAGSQGYEDADNGQAIEGVIRKDRVRHAEGMEEGRAVVGNRRRIYEYPDNQHDEIQYAEEEAPVLAEVAGDDAGIVFRFFCGSQGINK